MLQLTAVESEKFWPKISKSENNNDCWIWTGGKAWNGYGTFYYHKKHVRVPRLIYQMFNGEIPAGMNVLHRCDNPPCVNPNHLFTGTQLDNVHDAIKKGRLPQCLVRRTHCAKGHELTLDNTVIRKIKGCNCRVCRKCRRDYSREYKRRRRHEKICV